jgi:hypothetical protein
MNDPVLESVLKSKKYKNLHIPLIERIIAEESGKGLNRNTVKAVKNKLHQIYGCYANETGGADCGRSGDLISYAENLLKRHSSTRERFPFIPEFYDFIFSNIGTPETILDLGCGYNPFSLPLINREYIKGIKKYTAVDIDEPAIEMINRFFTALGLPDAAYCADIANGSYKNETADAVFMFKLIPVLNAQSKDLGYKILGEIKAETVTVTFPTQTLCGKKHGLKNNFEANYSKQFENALKTHNIKLSVINKTTIGSELIYILR